MLQIPHRSIFQSPFDFGSVLACSASRPFYPAPDNVCNYGVLKHAFTLATQRYDLPFHFDYLFALLLQPWTRCDIDGSSLDDAVALQLGLCHSTLMHCAALGCLFPKLLTFFSLAAASTYAPFNTLKHIPKRLLLWFSIGRQLFKSVHPYERQFGSSFRLREPIPLMALDISCESLS